MLKVFRCSIAFVILLVLVCQSLLLLLPDGHWGPFLTLATICFTLVLAGLLYRCSGYRERERPEQSKVSRDLQEEKEIPWSVFRKVVENMPIMFDAVDENGVVLFWNKECERITGYTSEEIVGNTNALELFYPDPVQRAKNVEEFLAFNGSYRDWDVDLLCKNGETRTISWSNISSAAPIPGWYHLKWTPYQDRFSLFLSYIFNLNYPLKCPVLWHRIRHQLIISDCHNI